MPRGIAHPPELRDQVVAAVHAGTSISQAARQFGLDKSVVSRWVATRARTHPPTPGRSVREVLLVRTR
jgi:transposase-like protein